MYSRYILFRFSGSPSHGVDQCVLPGPDAMPVPLGAVLGFLLDNGPQAALHILTQILNELITKT